MPTTVHLPGDLLESVDRRAKELRMSRNRFIVRALERAIYEETEWSEPFMNELTAAARDIEGHRDVDEMRVAISSARRSKAPPKL